METNIFGNFEEKINVNLKKTKKWKFLSKFLNHKSGLRGGKKPA
jgi:hypothetical protein